jgi:hypothetical protein
MPCERPLQSSQPPQNLVHAPEGGALIVSGFTARVGRAGGARTSGLVLEDFGVPRLDFVVCEAVLFAQEVDADSTEDCFLAEVRDESRAAVLQQFTEQFSAALLSKRWLRGFPGLLGLNAAGDGIEDGQLCLLNRRDGIIDRETRLPLKSLGIVFSAPDLSLSFSLGNSGLQCLDVGGDFRL